MCGANRLTLSLQVKSGAAPSTGNILDMAFVDEEESSEDDDEGGDTWEEGSVLALLL